MGFFVYIIKSVPASIYYKGFTEDPSTRLLQHNLGLSHYTANKIPWVLVYVEEFGSKREALVREKSLKKYSRKQIELLLASPKNIAHSFI